MMPFEHKVFDLDDTLIQTQVRYIQIKNETARYIKEVLETPLAEEEIEGIFSKIDIENIKTHAFGKERFPLSWKQAYETVAEMAGQRKTHASEVYETAYRIHTQTFDLYPGAMEVLRELRERGVRLSLLTLGEKSIQQKKVEDGSFGDYFDDIHIVEREKFHLLNGMKNKGKTSMVGNSLRSDIKPALDAGLSAFHINHDSWVHDIIEVDENHAKFHRLSTISDMIPYLDTLKIRT
jgi:putative hydrolase of the HAD superfamily